MRVFNRKFGILPYWTKMFGQEETGFLDILRHPKV